MKKFLLSIALFMFANSAFAVTDNYLCSKYTKLRIKSEEKVLAVGIRRVYTNSVETYVIGYGTPIKAWLNNIRIGSDLISKRRTLNCNGQRVGQIRVYDLSSFNIDTGLFLIRSADKEASTYIEIN